jgi:signal transduction histidine kinase
VTEAITADDLVVLNRSTIVARSLAAAAHSVNNSLLVISGTVELLESAPGPAVAPAGALDRIRTQAELAADAIRDVTDFARADVVSQARVDLHDVAARTVAMRAFPARRARVQLSFAPADGTPLMVHGNAALLLQAVLNLVINAEDALAGTKNATIAVETMRSHTEARLRVSDSGVGVAATDRDRVFQPWVSTRSRAVHQGLGLPVARHIAERHGGRLELAAEGSTAILSLPLAADR